MLSTVTEQHHFNFTIKSAEKNAFSLRKNGGYKQQEKVEESTFKLEYLLYKYKDSVFSMQFGKSGEIFPWCIYHTLPRNEWQNVQFYSKQWKLSFQINRAK